VLVVIGPTVAFAGELDWFNLQPNVTEDEILDLVAHA